LAHLPQPHGSECLRGIPLYLCSQIYLNSLLSAVFKLFPVLCIVNKDIFVFKELLKYSLGPKLKNKKKHLGGAWVAQSVERETHDLGV